MHYAISYYAVNKVAHREVLYKFALYCGSFLCNVFLIVLLPNFYNEDMLSSIFWSKCGDIWTSL